MEQNSVSVIIPTYKRAHLINRAINSVLNQTFQDFEIVVVIDGMDEDTLREVQKFIDVRIKYIVLDKNMGISAARNTGIMIAKGKYVALLDDDDEWVPTKLEKQLVVAERTSSEIGVIYSDYLEYFDDKYMSNYVGLLSGKKDERTQILEGRCIAPSVTIIKKECFEKVGLFNIELTRCEDWELWLRISEFYKFKKIPEALTIHHRTASQLSANEVLMIETREMIISSYFKNDKKWLAYSILIVGISWWNLGKKRKGQEYILKAIKSDPYNVLYICVFIATLGGVKSFKILYRIYKKLTLDY